MPALQELASLQILGHMQNQQTVSNTIHVAKPGSGVAPDVPTLQGLADEFWAYISTTYLATFHASGFVDQVVAKQVMDPKIKDSPLEAQHIVNAAGTHSPPGAVVPQSLCGVVSLKTQLASRRGRGHLFMPPALSATSFTADLLTVSDPYYVALTAFATALQKGCTLSPTWSGTHLSQWSLCIFSKAAALLSQTDVAICSAVIVKPKAYWLRSRSHGGT